MTKQEIKKKCMIMISIAILMISTGLQTMNTFGKEENYKIEYEYVNIKDMAQAKVTNKVETTSTSLDSLLIKNLNLNIKNETIEEVSLPAIKTLEAVEMPKTEPLAISEPPKPIWRLPTEMGVVTQNPHYGHAAHDITSPRGSNEVIFPVANGVITGIYTDPAGALVVTVLHNIDGRRYTSQYAHLSRFASGIYVGQEVTVNDALGYMGTTGYSTGVHLHLAVVECALFDPNDGNCSNLNNFFRYANSRAAQGDLGLGSVMIVPGSWNSR